jgi:hypothetical protein
VERRDISFYDVGTDRVRIDVTVRNESGRQSGPTVLVLQAAPLGAFLPWQPLTTLAVPALEPGESIELSTDVSRPRPTPLGDFANVPPRKLLTAVSPGDHPSRPAASRTGTVLRSLLGVRPRRSEGLADADKTPQLPPDLFELLGRSNPHWAGNINVFVGRKAVERHQAQALRVYPGRTNLAFFFVGTGRDGYAFHLNGGGAAWNAALYDQTSDQSVLIDRESDSAVRQSEWVQTSRPLWMILGIWPPEGCQQRSLEVHVTQRSTGETAIVEFSLDPTAAGPGCYVV